MFARDAFPTTLFGLPRSMHYSASGPGHQAYGTFAGTAPNQAWARISAERGACAVAVGWNAPVNHTYYTYDETMDGALRKMRARLRELSRVQHEASR